MTTPIVPQRPVRSKDQSGSSNTMTETPLVPPRPSRHYERSQSPANRDAYTRSPLNESPFAARKPSSAGFYQMNNNNDGEGFGRNPSVSSLPLIGQEGMEYASLDQALNNGNAGSESMSTPAQTRNVAGDLPLHAPRASVPAATARSQIASVTRTDSTHASAVGIGKPATEYEDQGVGMRRPSASKPSPRRVSQSYSPDMFRSKSRPESVHEHDHHEYGIPQFGLQVPMYPNAGDVQAPSPAPGSSSQPTGIGFFNDASRGGTGHGRKRSVQGFHGPPGSYGLHGHGAPTQDQFEKAWYSKHPDELVKEQEGAYGPSMAANRGQWALSSEELNKIVRETNSRNANLGTSLGMIGTPSEAIGYMASEEYTSRMSSPKVAALHLTKSRSRTASQNHMESPLRKASFPADLHDSDALESELEDDAIHLDTPPRRTDKYGGGGYDPPTEDLGPQGGNTEELGGWINERGTGTPILASDESAKDPNAEYLQPAISPEMEKRGDDTYFSPSDSETPAPYQSGLRTRSRSRPRSTHEKSGLSRFISHGEYDSHQGVGTPLEDVDEYEPLFKDDDESGPQKPLTAADRLKRPEIENRRFPSQDIWEDTPNSLQYTTEVSGPQEPEDLSSPVAKKPATLFESPEKEAARKGEVLESERLSFLQNPDAGFAKPKFNAGVQQEMTRPGMRQRFPSQDIWEDTPDSLRLETTVDPADTSDTTSPKVISPSSGQQFAAMNSVARGFEAADPALTAPLQTPAIPARPARSQPAEVVTSQPAESAPAQPAAVAPSQPSVPARPSRRSQQEPSAELSSSPPQSTVPSSTERKAPSVPERPKPQVPPRPARAAQDEPLAPAPTPANDGEAVSPEEKSTSTSSKPKPLVPIRPPTSSKFASLKAGFMNDLNSRLQLGPQAPPKPQPAPEVEEEKAPLTDARKGRARGPARRRPAESSETNAAPSGSKSFSIAQPLHTWSIDPSTPHDIKVGKQYMSPPIKTAAQFSEQPSASPLARNTAGESLLPPSEAPATTSGALAHEANADMDARAQREEEQQKENIRPYVEQTIGHVGDIPEGPPREQTLPASGSGPGKQVDSTVMGAEAVAEPSEGQQTLESKDDAEFAREPLLGGVVNKEFDNTIARMADTEVAPETATEVAGKTDGETMPGEFPSASTA